MNDFKPAPQVAGSERLVVASSESETSDLVREARQLGVAAIVKKPWKPQELAEVVRLACATRGQKPSP